MIRWLCFVLATAALVANSSSASAQTAAERQNFGKIKLGMTEAEVKQLLPSNPKQSTSPGGYKVLTWGPDSDSIAVLFADGRVSTVERTSKSVDIHWGRIIGLAGVVLIVIGAVVFFIMRRRRIRSARES